MGIRSPIEGNGSRPGRIYLTMKPTRSIRIPQGDRFLPLAVLSVMSMPVIAVMTVMAVMSGCQLQQRRVDVPTASGADETLEARFGLTADAQDPTERDKELGYGMWKAKPEPEGTAAPESPQRRGQHWGGGGSPR